MGGNDPFKNTNLTENPIREYSHATNGVERSSKSEVESMFTDLPRLMRGLHSNKSFVK